eukprot:1924871-Pyramimonas_sp.AAC.1
MGASTGADALPLCNSEAAAGTAVLRGFGAPAGRGGRFRGGFAGPSPVCAAFEALGAFGAFDGSLGGGLGLTGAPLAPEASQPFHRFSQLDAINSLYAGLSSHATGIRVHPCIVNYGLELAGFSLLRYYVRVDSIYHDSIRRRVIRHTHEIMCATHPCLRGQKALSSSQTAA